MQTIFLLKLRFRILVGQRTPLLAPSTWTDLLFEESWMLNQMTMAIGQIEAIRKIHDPNQNAL